MKWTDANVPSVAGKSFLITGANSGLGLETARVLARKGAWVGMACRTPAKAQAALDSLKAENPSAQLDLYSLDLSDLESVRACTARLQSEGRLLDGLINNAGLMAIPFSRTRQGIEMQLGTNHFGHFALSGLLLPLLKPDGRVVTVSSGAHNLGDASVVEDIGYEKRSYGRWKAYGNSKIANLLFMLELDRRLKKAGSSLRSLSAHPGYAATELQGKGASMGGPAWEGWFMNLGNSLMAQSAAAGAWPQLRAATDPEAKSGDYFGPSFVEFRGPAVLVKPNRTAQNPDLAARLWALSVEKTGVDFGGI